MALIHKARRAVIFVIAQLSCLTLLLYAAIAAGSVTATLCVGYVLMRAKAQTPLVRFAVDLLQGTTSCTTNPQQIEPMDFEPVSCVLS